MAYVPNYQDYDEPWAESRVTITVYPPSTTKRPIGFAPWPKEKKQKKRKKASRR